MSSHFRLGLVGGGRMGQTHIRALRASSDVAITAVAEPFAPTAAALAEAGLTVHSSLDTMLAAGHLDGVLVCTPTDQHLDTVSSIVEVGLPILCEKPCGLSPDQARECGQIASRQGVQLQVAYWRRFVPSLRSLKMEIASGALGNVHMLLCAQWDEAPPPAAFRAHSGGIFIDMGVHEIDQARWLVNSEPTSLAAVSFPELEDPQATGDVDSAQALLAMSNGTAVTISLGRFHPGGDLVSAEVFAARGHKQVPVLLPADGEAVQLEALRLQAESFARWVRGGEVEGATIEDAIAALDIAQRLTAAVSQRPTKEVA